MTSHNTSKAQQAKATPPSSSSPKPYPVSIRAYRKKDYEYLTNFPRAAVNSNLRPSSSDAELSLAQSDSESVSTFSATTRSTDFGTSTSSASSVVRHAKDVMYMESSPHLVSTQASTGSAHEDMDLPRSDVEAEDEKHEKVIHLGEENEREPAPIEENFAQAKALQKPSQKARPRRAHGIWSLCCKASVSDSMRTG